VGRKEERKGPGKAICHCLNSKTPNLQKQLVTLLGVERGLVRGRSNKCRRAIAQNTKKKGRGRERVDIEDEAPESHPEGELVNDGKGQGLRGGEGRPEFPITVMEEVKEVLQRNRSLHDQSRAFSEKG